MTAAGKTALHTLDAFLRNSQLPPPSTNDHSPRGQSFVLGFILRVEWTQRHWSIVLVNLHGNI